MAMKAKDYARNVSTGPAFSLDGRLFGSVARAMAHLREDVGMSQAEATEYLRLLLVEEAKTTGAESNRWNDTGDPL